MRIHRRPVFCRKGDDLPDQFSGAGVLRMYAERKAGQVAHAVQRIVVFLDQFDGLAEIVDAAHLHHAKAHFVRRLRDGFRREIHLHGGRRSSREILQDRKARQLVDIVGRQLCLIRKDLGIQPLVQRQIVRRGTQKSHAGMRMCIFKAGHQEVSSAVDLPVKDSRLRIFACLVCRAPHIGDRIPVSVDFARNDIFAIQHCQDSDIVEPYSHLFHLLLLTFWPLSSSCLRQSFLRRALPRALPWPQHSP